MQGLSEYEFLATADTLIDEIRDEKGLCHLQDLEETKKSNVKSF